MSADRSAPAAHAGRGEKVKRCKFHPSCNLATFKREMERVLYATGVKRGGEAETRTVRSLEFALWELRLLVAPFNRLLSGTQRLRMPSRQRPWECGD